MIVKSFEIQLTALKKDLKADTKTKTWSFGRPISVLSGHRKTDKYEKDCKAQYLDRRKFEEIAETLNDFKIKLQFQVEQSTSHEKLHGDIMDNLNTYSQR